VIVQFFRYGGGLSKGPFDYLLGKKRDREHAKILSGSEQEVAGLIDSSPFAKKYTAGCLSFYESDLSDEAKSKIMADFEHCLFPGMSPDQYRILWIEHKDKLNEQIGKHRLELNFVIPNTEILTGKRLQPFYHKADLPRVDMFKKITNFEHQLHDPDDPCFRQAITTRKSLPKKTSEIKTVIDTEALKAIKKGIVTDHQSLKKWLTALGLEITGAKPNSISIRNPHNDDEKSRPIRLTGAIYEQDFRVTAESAELTKSASERYKSEARKRYGENLQRYREQLDRKSKDLKQKYQQRDVELEKAGQPKQERARDPNFEQQRVSEKASERSHERDYRADYNRQEDVAESTYTSNQRTSGSPPEASRELTGELARVEPLTRRDSAPSDFEKSPYYVSLAVDYSSWRFSYEQYRNRTLSKFPKRSVNSNKSRNQGFTNEGSNLEYFDLRQTIVRTDRSKSFILRGELPDSSGEVNEQSRSAAIADYRRTTAAIEAATAAARESLESARRTAESIRVARESLEATRRLHSDLTQKERGRSADRQTLSGDSEKTLRAKSFRAFFTSFTKRIGNSFKDACEEFSEFFRRTKRVDKLVKGDFAELGRNRDRDAAQATYGATIKQTGLSRELSRKVSEFNPGHIFKVVDELDKRNELKAKQWTAERSSGLDFEM
jgi:hypothetical protein